MNNKNRKKKKHPYATLAVFTLAGAAVINMVEKGKNFVYDKIDAMKSFMKRESKDS